MIQFANQENALTLIMSKLMFRTHTDLKSRSTSPLLSWEMDGWGLTAGPDMSAVFGAIGSPEHNEYKQDDGPDCNDYDGIDDTYGSATKTFGAATLISFDWMVSSEEGYDFFSFSVNGHNVVYAAGDVEWMHCVKSIPAGAEVTFKFEKDCCCMEGDDTMYVKNIRFGAFGSIPDTPEFDND